MPRSGGGSAMPCPRCGEISHVTETRLTKQGQRRRRRCIACDERFTTLEVLVSTKLHHGEGRIVSMTQPQIASLKSAADVIAKMLDGHTLARAED